MALEEATTMSEKQEVPRTNYVVVCSVRTPRSLKEYKERLLRFSKAHHDGRLSNLAFFTTARFIYNTGRASYVVDAL